MTTKAKCCINLLADYIPWSHLNSLLQIGTDFTIANSKNGVIMPDGIWIGTAEGVGRECKICLASILKSKAPLKAPSKCIYVALCAPIRMQKGAGVLKLKHVQRDQHRKRDQRGEQEKNVPDAVQAQLEEGTALRKFLRAPRQQAAQSHRAHRLGPAGGPSATSFPASQSVFFFFSVS